MSKKPRKATPAQRVRARRDPAVASPPLRPRGDRASSVRELALSIAGREYPIGANVEGDTPWELTIEGAATVTIPVRSPDESLLVALANEALMQEDGVRVTIDDVVYVLTSVSGDDTGLLTLVFEDEVAWRLRQFSRFIASSRGKSTRALFIKRMVDEASRAPLAPMQAFIPELGDKQRILSTKASSS